MPGISLSADETRRFRLLSQGLAVPTDALPPHAPAMADTTDPGADAVLNIVRRAGGIQAQDMNAAPLQVRARSAALTRSDVIRAISEDRAIVRTWLMRGTLHIIPVDDHRWMTSLFGAASFSAGHGRRLQLGLDERTLDTALTHAVDILNAEGPLTRRDLAERLAPLGIGVADQGFHHIVRSGGFLGILCHGPLVDGRTETFAATDSWLGGIERPALERDEALARLARIYINAFGPSTTRDFAAWAGLPLRDARAGWHAIEDNLLEVVADGEAAWIHEDDAPRLTAVQQPAPHPALRLLGYFDTYLLGYRGRGLAVAQEHFRRVNAGGGMIRPVVLIDGRAVATWSLKRDTRAGTADVSIEPFPGLEDALTPAWAQEAVQREIDDIGRFLGLESSAA